MKKGLKMYRQLVLLLLLLIVLVFATNIFFYMYNLKQIREYHQEQIQKSSSFISEQIGMQISYIYQFCRDILSRPELTGLATEDPTNEPWNYYADVNEIMHKMNLFDLSGNFIEDCFIVFKEKNMILSTKNGLDEYVENKRYEDLQNIQKITRLQIQLVAEELFLFDFPQQYVRSILAENLSYFLGIQINKDKLIKYISDSLNDDLLGIELIQDETSSLIKHEVEVPKGIKLYIWEAKIAGTSQTLKLTYGIPIYGKTFLLLSVIICGCFLLTILGTVFYVKRMNFVIHKPIRKIIKAFKDVEDGCYNVELRGDETEEFSYLYEAIRNILSRLKTSIEKEYEQRLALQNSEIKQYQLQINPHFLYNGFYNIQRMCSNQQYEKVIILSTRLSSYYRYITRNGISFVALSEEIKHMEDYIDIQSIRFQDRILVIKEYKLDGIEQVRVPRLIFQPLLENIYEHAFNTIEAEGKIFINMAIQDSFLHCSIEDTGEGMEVETLEQMNKWLETDSGYTECTGILNVNKRLKLHYGAQSGLHYSVGKEKTGVRIDMHICF